MKHKALVLSAALLLGGASSCDNATRPATTGSISLVLLTEAGQPMALSAAQGLVGGGADAQLSAIPLDGARITVTGPTTRTVTSTTASGGFFNLVVDGLLPGSYVVSVEGLVGTAVAHFGQASGIVVTAGNSTPASMTFPSFQPAIANVAVVDTAEVLRYTIAYGAVTNATSYIVQWSTSPTMSGASSQTVTGTSAEITVPSEGKYYIAVKAVNAVVTSAGLASPAKGVYLLQSVAAVTVSPAAQTIAAGATLQFSAEGRDADNVVVPNVTWFWASSNHTVATVSQTGLVTGNAGGAVSITAVGKGMPGSTGLSVTAPSPYKLAFSIQPTNSTAGDALSPAVQVEIQDVSGNRITDARDAVTIAFAANPGGGTLAGTKVINAINGIASFSGLWVNKSGTSYTLAASSGTLTGATSSGFNIVAGAPAKLGFSQQPTNVLGNTAMAPPVTVTIADQFDNAVTTAANNVTVSFSDNPWRTPFATGGTLSGTRTVAAVGGVATFNSLRIDKPAPGYGLSAGSGSLIAATSSSFNVNLTVSQVSASGNHTCAVTTGGTYCWGYNGDGQLGTVTGSTSTDSIPGLVRGPQTFVTVTAGNSHTCALTAAGAAFCWGSGGNGRLGNNGTTNSDVPVAVSGGHAFSAIEAGTNHTCGITTASGTAAEDRQVYCWGFNGAGQLGDNSVTQSLIPVRVAEPLQTAKATVLSAGSQHTCAVAAGSAYCWGDDAQGQLGDDGLIADKLVPTVVAGGLTWTSVTAGNNHSCGILADNSGRCWGYNQYGQLGDNAVLPGPTQNPLPVVVFGGLQFGSISAGGVHTCGVTTGGSGYCWGYNGEGSLGDDNAPNNSSQRVLVVGGHTFAAITAGSSQSSCGRTTAPTVGVFCWGPNWAGQLGSPGTSNFKDTPTQIIQ